MQKFILDQEESTMKKFISVILAVLMIFSIIPISAFALNTYNITFTDLPYDIAPYRNDYVGAFMGYEYGTDYWFTITNADGTKTDIKGWPYTVTVYEGDPLEFTVSVADYVDPTSVRALAFPSELIVPGVDEANNPILTAPDLYDAITGEPYAQYHVAASSGRTFGIKPTRDLTVCVSEYHLYNNAFLYNFPVSDYYTANRVKYRPQYSDPWDIYSSKFEWGNTEVIRENETMYFEVRIPMDDPDHVYHYEDYQVYYTTGAGRDLVTTYLKRPASSENPQAVDTRVAHYVVEADEEKGVRAEWVDVYKIPNVKTSVNIRVAGTVTYTLEMLREFFRDFDINNLDALDLSTVDFAPMVEYITRVLMLIMKILAGFGLSVGG